VVAHVVALHVVSHVVALHVVAHVVALHELSHECVWLRSIIQHVRQTCGLYLGKIESTTIYEDNSVLLK